MCIFNSGTINPVQRYDGTTQCRKRALNRRIRVNPYYHAQK